MKRLAIAATLALALLAPASASAVTEYNRQIATRCVSTSQGDKIRATKVIDQSTWITPQYCTEVQLNPYKAIGRPFTDVWGATDAADHWWGHCIRQLYFSGWWDEVGGTAQPPYFFTYWHLWCP